MEVLAKYQTVFAEKVGSIPIFRAKLSIKNRTIRNIVDIYQTNLFALKDTV